MKRRPINQLVIIGTNARHFDNPASFGIVAPVFKDYEGVVVCPPFRFDGDELVGGEGIAIDEYEDFVRQEKLFNLEVPIAVKQDYSLWMAQNGVISYETLDWIKNEKRRIYEYEMQIAKKMFEARDFECCLFHCYAAYCAHPSLEPLALRAACEKIQGNHDRYYLTCYLSKFYADGDFKELVEKLVDSV